MPPAVYRVEFGSPLDIVPPQPSLNSQPSFQAAARSARDASLPPRSWKRPDALQRLYERSAKADKVGTWEGEALLRRAVEGGAPLAKRDLAPNSTQKVTLGIIGAYVVIIAILWNVPVVHWVLWPLKMLTIAFHEFGHAIMGLCTGAKVKSITLDPREGGCTMMAGGVGAITLPAGYLGSSLIGAALIACGFDITASKIASIVVGVAFLMTLWWGRRDWLTIGTILFAVGIMIGFWWVAHGAGLRFIILFIGVMNSMYSAFDICDDLIFRKVNESDASVFAKRYGGSPQCWGVIWAIISLGMAVCGILVGLAAFKETFAEQATQGKDFLPTRLLF
ncbi:hypothetical protein JCM1840_003353 [Sporobolomyces johnsonii]